jgi:pyrimidodiazepine synthase
LTLGDYDFYIFPLLHNRYDVVNVNLTHKPEFIFEKNPGGKVPTIEMAKGSLYESLIVCDFMDEAFPESGPGGDNGRLNPSDPFLKALDRIWVENFSKVRIAKSVQLNYSVTRMM